MNNEWTNRNPRTQNTYAQLDNIQDPITGAQPDELFVLNGKVGVNKHSDPPFVVGNRGRVVMAAMVTIDGDVVARTITIDEDNVAWIPTNWL